jgi:hypothetical protein
VPCHRAELAWLFRAVACGGSTRSKFSSKQSHQRRNEAVRPVAARWMSFKALRI